jgi:hypothetical protein
MDYIFFLMIYLFLMIYNDSTKENRKCILKSRNLQHELSNIKLYLNITNVKLPDDLNKYITE